MLLVSKCCGRKERLGQGKENQQSGKQEKARTAILNKVVRVDLSERITSLEGGKNL